MHVCVFVHVCMHMCVRVCVCAWMCACVCMSMDACLCAFVRVYVCDLSPFRCDEVFDHDLVEEPAGVDPVP